MKKIGILAVLFFIAITCSASANGSANQPTLIIGESWVFKAVTKDSISSTTDRLDGEYTVTYKNNELEVTKDGAFVGFEQTAELKRMILTDEREYLKFPLATGNKWTGTHTVRSGRRNSTRTMDYTVLRVEGDCYLVKGISESQTGNGIIRQERTFTYSVLKKSIVNFFYDSAVGGSGGKIEIELIKYTPAK